MNSDRQKSSTATTLTPEMPNPSSKPPTGCPHTTSNGSEKKLPNSSSAELSAHRKAPGHPLLLLFQRRMEKEVSRPECVWTTASSTKSQSWTPSLFHELAP